MQVIEVKSKLPLGILFFITMFTSLVVGVYLGRNMSLPSVQNIQQVSLIPTPTSTPKPEIFKKRNIGGTIYAIKKERLSLDIYDVQLVLDEDDDWSQRVIAPNQTHPWGKEVIVDFWYDEGTNVLFTVEEISRPEPTGRVMAYKISPDKITSDETYSWPSVQTSTDILNYYPQTKMLLLKTEGGGGCGGTDEIWSLTNNTKRSIHEFAWGSRPNLSHYVGFWNGKVIAADYTLENSPGGCSDRVGVNKIYLFDPLKLTTETIAIKSDLPDDVVSVNMFDSPTYGRGRIDVSNSIMLDNNDVDVSNHYKLDLETKEITRVNQ